MSEMIDKSNKDAYIKYLESYVDHKNQQLDKLYKVTWDLERQIEEAEYRETQEAWDDLKQAFLKQFEPLVKFIIKFFPK